MNLVMTVYSGDYPNPTSNMGACLQAIGMRGGGTCAYLVIKFEIIVKNSPY